MKEIKNGRYEETTRTAWYLNNQLHREDGPAVEYHSNDRKGQQDWYLHGLLHRIGGPAALSKSGSKGWYIYGKLHREDGPALEWHDGKKSWWLNNNPITEEEFNQWLDKKNLNQKLESNLPTKLLIKRTKM